MMMEVALMLFWGRCDCGCSRHAAIAARPGLRAVQVRADDGVLPGRGLGRRAGYRQHRSRSVTLAVRPRRRRPAVSRARLLVDSAERGTVGVRPGQLPGHYAAGAAD